MGTCQLILLSIVLYLGSIQAKPHIVLEYKPTRPLYRPNPGYFLPQIVPPGYPWPASWEGYFNFSQTTITPSINFENKFKETTTTRDNTLLENEQITTRKPSNQNSINLEYQPMRPSFHPSPGNLIGQIVPPGKPWPASAEGYTNFSQTSMSTNLENRFKETTENPKTTAINLEYQPMRPSFHPSPGNLIGQIVPPGKPWPASPEEYTNFSQSSISTNLENRFKETTEKPKTTVINLEYQPMRPSFHPSPGNLIGQIVPPGKPWPASAEEYTNFSQTSMSTNLENRFKETTENPKITPINLEYKPMRPLNNEYQPMRPSFHPSPGNVLQQIIGPGKPWPENAEGYLNFSQTSAPSNSNLDNRFKETTIRSTTVIQPQTETNKINSSTEGPTTTVINLEYKPTRPSFHPSPGNVIQQIIETGKPWPANAEENTNFSQTSISTNLDNRIKETTLPLTTTVQSTSSRDPIKSTTQKSQTTVINLGYKPTRPFYHPNPGNYVGQIVPPGKPWPASAEGYVSSSQSMLPTTEILEDRFKETTTLKEIISTEIASELPIITKLNSTASFIISETSKPATEINSTSSTHIVETVTMPQLFTSKKETSTIADHIEIILNKLNKTTNLYSNNVQASNLLLPDSEDIFNPSISQTEELAQQIERFERPKFIETPKKNIDSIRDRQLQFFPNPYKNYYNNRNFQPYFVRLFK